MNLYDERMAKKIYWAEAASNGTRVVFSLIGRKEINTVYTMVQLTLFV